MTLPAPNVRITREDLVERISRFLVQSRGAAIVTSESEWPLTVAHYREMCAKHPNYSEGRSLVNDAFRDASDALSAIHEAGCAVVPREATQRMLDEISTHEEPYASLGDGYTTNAKRWREMVDVGDLAAADLARESQKEG